MRCIHCKNNYTSKCEICSKKKDYNELPTLILILDLVLLKTEAFEHISYNTEPKYFYLIFFIYIISIEKFIYFLLLSCFTKIKIIKFLLLFSLSNFYCILADNLIIDYVILLCNALLLKSVENYTISKAYFIICFCKILSFILSNLLKYIFDILNYFENLHQI